MMYKCEECGTLFEEGEQARYTENIGEFQGVAAMHEWYGCPLCGGNYEDIKPCALCGGYETKETYEDVCENCKTKLLKTFRTLIADNFTTEERAVLNELLDGEDI